MSIAHQELVAALAKDGETIRSEMTADNAHLIHMIMGMAGEVGELLDAVKKSVIYNKSLDMENVIEELGDIEFYMAGFRDGLEIDRDETLKANITKLKIRYDGMQYSDQSAQNRADKA